MKRVDAALLDDVVLFEELAAMVRDLEHLDKTAPIDLDTRLLDDSGDFAPEGVEWLVEDIGDRFGIRHPLEAERPFEPGLPGLFGRALRRTFRRPPQLVIRDLTLRIIITAVRAGHWPHAWLESYPSS